MRSLAFVFATAVFALAFADAVAGAALAPPGVDAVEFEKAARTILCNCGCPPQSIYDCACGHAAQMREQVAGLIRGGKTGDEVIASYVAQYGQQIRIAPTASGFNLLAWVGPGVAFLVAATGLALVLRRWRRSVPATTRAHEPAASEEENAPYVARLERELKEYR